MATTSCRVQRAHRETELLAGALHQTQLFALLEIPERALRSSTPLRGERGPAGRCVCLAEMRGLSGQTPTPSPTRTSPQHIDWPGGTNAASAHMRSVHDDSPLASPHDAPMSLDPMPTCIVSKSLESTGNDPPRLELHRPDPGAQISACDVHHRALRDPVRNSHHPLDRHPRLAAVPQRAGAGQAPGGTVARPARAAGAPGEEEVGEEAGEEALARLAGRQIAVETSLQPGGGQGSGTAESIGRLAR